MRIKINLKEKKQESRFKIEVRYEMVDASTETTNYTPIQIAKGPMVVDLSLDDEIGKFSYAMGVTQWWGISKYYENTDYWRC